MRPSRVETSEPAWVNRKRLSMNSRTSWSCTSRKYSAMVRAERATRVRVPGCSVQPADLPGGCLAAAPRPHHEEEAGALTRPLTDAGEHRRTGELTRDTGDHLLDQHGLADTGAAEQADLPALDVGREQVDDL